MADNPLSLFRTEAVAARQTRNPFGTIVLIRPLSFTVLTASALAVAALLVGFFIWGSYTRHVTLHGQLVPTKGVIEVHSPHSGSIVESRISEGDSVQAGQTLYLVSSEVFSESKGSVQAFVGEQYSLQEKSLLEQIRNTTELEAQERDALLGEQGSLKDELAKVRTTIGMIESQLTLSAQRLDRFAKMSRDGLVSQDQYANAEIQHLEVQTRLQGAEREQTVLARRITEVGNRLMSLPSRYATERAEIEQNLASTRQGLTANEERQLIEIRAPTAGIATAPRAAVGQVIDPNQALVSIVPSDAVLEAQLLAPTRAVGFLRSGNVTMIRYDAYPYQRFGHHRGRVESVSRAPLDTQEPTDGPTTATNEPSYRVTVSLPSQSVTSNGEPFALQAGMTVQGDVLLDTRRLYQWVLEPLYSIRGRLHTNESER